MATTEETALLEAVDVTLPFLQDYISRLNSLLLEDKDQLSSTDILRPAQLASRRALTTSFSLLVLLIFRKDKINAKSPHSTPWDAWKHETNVQEWVKIIDENVEHVWTSFLNAFCSPRDIEIALWTEFRMNEKGKPLRGTYEQLIPSSLILISIQWQILSTYIRLCSQTE